MPALTIVANITAKADHVDRVRAELEKLVVATRQEVGCINYDLHVDNENPGHFLFYENWETKPHWEAHMETPHLKAFRALAEDTVEEIAVQQMTQIA